MANVKLIFQGTEKSETHKTELEVYCNAYEEISVVIKLNSNYPSFISLDKITAVRLVRELKKQIGFLDLKGGNTNE